MAKKLLNSKLLNKNNKQPLRRHKIKIELDLPKWFNRENYTSAAQLSATGWYEQLFIRYFLYYHNNLNASLDLIEKIRNKPIIAIEDDFRFGTIMNFSPSKLHQKACSSVHFTTLRELIMYLGTNPDNFAYAFQYLRQNHLNPNIDYMSFIDEPHICINDETYTNHLSVSFDLNLPEKILIEEFTDLIRKTKSEKTKEKRHQKYNFKNWHEYGILPYLDLQAWATQHGKEITTKLLMEVIYPDGVRSEENMKKTTIINAQELMNYSALLKLASQIN